MIAGLLLAAPYCPADPVPILPVSQIHPGMTGVGRTVFQGDSIETFQVRILGTLKNFMPKKDVILAELLGDKLKYTGVVAGMSGGLRLDFLQGPDCRDHPDPADAGHTGGHGGRSAGGGAAQEPSAAPSRRPR